MAGLGRKEWSPGDTLTASDVNGYLMDQAVMVFAGTAARASAIPSPSAGMVAYSTATSLQVYNGTAWVDLSTGYGVATGGSSSSITVGGTAYTLLTFTTSGTLTVTKSGLFDLFVVAGGSGGGFYSNSDGRGGGGGAGGGTGLVTAYLTANQTVTIGGKGLNNANGSASRVGTVMAAIGGTGSGANFGYIPFQGASGGGSLNGAGGAGSVPQGNNGGSGTFGVPPGAGGGGGYGAVGGNGTSGTGGAGGTGYDISAFIGGSSTFILGGGGGGGSPTAGNAGSSTGGNGAVTGAGSNATATAYGSGGGGGQTAGGNGADGVAYVRFKV